MLEIAGAVAMVGIASALALRPALGGTFWAFGVMFVPYLGMAVVYVVRSARQGNLSAKLKPKSGDLTLGFVMAGLLFLCVMLGRSVLTPAQTVREVWAVRLYLQVGPAAWVQKNLIWLSLLTGLLGALEEVAWRGYILSEIDRRLGRRAAWPATAALNAIALIPTMVVAGDPTAGLNPVLVLIALGTGLVWGFLVTVTDRLPVAVLSHALFSWAVIVQFPLLRFAY